MARAAKVRPARAANGYAAPTNGKATKKSSAARTSTKFLLLALVVLYGDAVVAAFGVSSDSEWFRLCLLAIIWGLCARRRRQPRRREA